MDKLIEWTNKHAELYPLDKEAEHLRVLQSAYSYRNYYRAGH